LELGHIQVKKPMKCTLLRGFIRILFQYFLILFIYTSFPNCLHPQAITQMFFNLRAETSGSFRSPAEFGHKNRQARAACKLKVPCGTLKPRGSFAKVQKSDDLWLVNQPTSPR